VLDRLEKGIAGYERIARHAVSAEAALVITAQGLEGDEAEVRHPSRRREPRPRLQRRVLNRPRERACCGARARASRASWHHFEVLTRISRPWRTPGAGDRAHASSSPVGPSGSQDLALVGHGLAGTETLHEIAGLPEPDVEATASR
jgi:hypothetical protein